MEELGDGLVMFGGFVHRQAAFAGEVGEQADADGEEVMRLHVCLAVSGFGLATGWRLSQHLWPDWFGVRERRVMGRS